MAADIVRNIYVDIDSILDTRLALLFLLSESTFTKVTSDKTYVNRLRDNFGNISSDIFNNLYKNRNKQLLKLALPTPVANLARKLYNDELTDPRTSVEDDIVFYINIYPYDLTSDEMGNLANGFLKGEHAPVKFISMSNEELTPEWVSQHVGTMFKYDAIDWIELQNATLKFVKNPLLNTSIYLPTITKLNIDSNALDKKFFIELMNASVSLVRLLFIDTINFCGVMKKEKE